MKGRDIVSARQLIRIVNQTALINGLYAPRPEEIASMYYASEAKRMPIIKRCANGMLWVDRYYAAFQIGDGDVRYVYISERHIAEELNAYREASHQRGADVRLPKDILECFKKAQACMRGNGTRYWVDPEIQEKLERIAAMNITEHCPAV